MYTLHTMGDYPENNVTFKVFYTDLNVNCCVIWTFYPELKIFSSLDSTRTSLRKRQHMMKQ